MEETGEKPTDRSLTVDIFEDNFEVTVKGDILIIDLIDFLKTLMEELIDELESQIESGSKFH